MEDGRLERLVPLAGALFGVIFAVAFLTAGDTPDPDASGREVISHYDDHGKIIVAILGLSIAAVLFVFFVGVLRARLRDAGSEWLATVVFGGGIGYAVALGIFAMSQVALWDAADLGQPEVAQTLNIIDNDNFFPAVISLSVVLLAAGWHCVRSRVLPVWLAWIAVALGVLALAGPAGFVSFLAFPIWVIVASIWLYTHPSRRPADGDLAISLQVIP